MNQGHLPTVNDKQSERRSFEDGRTAGVVSLDLNTLGLHTLASNICLVRLPGLPDHEVTLRLLPTLCHYRNSTSEIQQKINLTVKI